LRECLGERGVLKSVFCGILSKKIASIGVWGNGRFPQLNLPSALAVAKQVYRFLFAVWGVLIAFNVGLVLQKLCYKRNTSIYPICYLKWESIKTA